MPAVSTGVVVSAAHASGKTAVYTIDVSPGDAAPFTVKRTSADLVKFAAEIAKAYAAGQTQVQFGEFPSFKTSGKVDAAFLNVSQALVQQWLDESLQKLPTAAERAIFSRALQADASSIARSVSCEKSSSGSSNGRGGDGMLEHSPAASSSSSAADADETQALARLTAAVRERLAVATDALERGVLEQLVRTPSWLVCFLRANDDDLAVATTSALSHAAYAKKGVGPASEIVASPRLFVQGEAMIELLTATDGADRPIGFVRDISRLSSLLRQYSFDDISAAHLWRLKSLLMGNILMQRRGVTLIQDLSQLSARLQLQVLEPRNLLAQARVIRYIFSGSFPIRWGTLVLIDAPALFSPVWRALKEFLPEHIVNKVHFLKSPCHEELVKLVGAAAAAEIANGGGGGGANAPPADAEVLDDCPFVE